MVFDARLNYVVCMLMVKCVYRLRLSGGEPVLYFIPCLLIKEIKIFEKKKIDECINSFIQFVIDQELTVRE